MLTLRKCLLLLAISFWWLSWSRSLGEWIEIIQKNNNSFLNKEEFTNLLTNNKVYLLAAKPRTFTIESAEGNFSDQSNPAKNSDIVNEQQNKIKEIEIKVKLPNSAKKSIAKINKDRQDNVKEKGKAATPSVRKKTEFPSIEGFIRFLRNMQNVWVNKSIFRVEDKIRSLYALKDNLYRIISKCFK